MDRILSLTGTFVNIGTVLLGGFLGLLLKRGLPERISDTVMKGLALCVLYIGISGCLEGKNALVAVVSVAVGAVLGGALDLDGKINRLARKIEKKLIKNEGESRFAEGMTAATLLFCVGAMTIVGSFNSGIAHDYSTLITKAVIDGVACVVMASTMGAGVLLSVVPLFVYQGSLTLLAGLISPYLNDYMISEITSVGSLLIIAIALNMLNLTKIKVMNYVPAVILPVVVCLVIK